MNLLHHTNIGVGDNKQFTKSGDFSLEILHALSIGKPFFTLLEEVQSDMKRRDLLAHLIISILTSTVFDNEDKKEYLTKLDEEFGNKMFVGVVQSIKHNQNTDNDVLSHTHKKLLEDIDQAIQETKNKHKEIEEGIKILMPLLAKYTFSSVREKMAVISTISFILSYYGNINVRAVYQFEFDRLCQEWIQMLLEVVPSKRGASTKKLLSYMQEQFSSYTMELDVGVIHKDLGLFMDMIVDLSIPDKERLVDRGTEGGKKSLGWFHQYIAVFKTKSTGVLSYILSDKKKAFDFFCLLYCGYLSAKPKTAGPKHINAHFDDLFGKPNLSAMSNEIVGLGIITDLIPAERVLVALGLDGFQNMATDFGACDLLGYLSGFSYSLPWYDIIMQKVNVEKAVYMSFESFIDHNIGMRLLTSNAVENMKKHKPYYDCFQIDNQGNMYYMWDKNAVVDGTPIQVMSIQKLNPVEQLMVTGNPVVTKAEKIQKYSDYIVIYAEILGFGTSGTYGNNNVQPVKNLLFYKDGKHIGTIHDRYDIHGSIENNMFVGTGKTGGVRGKRHIVQIPPGSHVSTSDTTRELKTTSNPWSMTTSIGPISDGVFKTVCEVSSGTIYTYTNPKSRETILQIKSTGQYTDMGDFHEGLANVQQRRKNPTDKDNFGYYRGFIDKKGKLVIPCQFSQAGNFSEGKVWVYYDGTYWVIDRQGKKLFDIILGDTVLKGFEIIGMGALGFQEGMCRIVVRNTDTESVDRIMFVDSKGVIFERPRYLEVLEATDFAGGLSKVKLRNGEWGLLDKFGQFYEIGNIQ